MLEAAGSLAQAVANTLFSSSHGEAELLLGLVVGVVFVADLLRGRDTADHGASDLNHHPRS